jgi:hypothetical protein
MAAKDPQTCECCYHVALREKALQWPQPKANPQTEASRKADAALDAAVQREEAARADFDAAASARRSEEIAALGSKFYDSRGREQYEPGALEGIARLRKAERAAYDSWQMAGNKTVEARQKAMAESQRALLQAIENNTF